MPLSYLTLTPVVPRHDQSSLQSSDKSSYIATNRLWHPEFCQNKLQSPLNGLSHEMNISLKAVIINRYFLYTCADSSDL
jgi:hypothetical protein